MEKHTHDNAGNLTAFNEGEVDGEALHEWVEDAETRFGQIPERVDLRSLHSDEHEYDALSRMTRYDGASRLVGIEELVANDPTTLHYDVDDQLVREERDGAVIRRLLGHRRGPDPEWGGAGSMQSIEPVLANVRPESIRVGAPP